MNIQRFTASTSRQALAKARMAFGDETLILANRSTDEGVEVLATGESTLALEQRRLAPQARPASFSNRVRDQFPEELRREPGDNDRDAQEQVEDDAARLAMSTLSFQDYVRDRMLRRRQEALSGLPDSGATDRPRQKPKPALPSPASPPATAKPNRAELAAPAKPVLARSSTDSLVDEFHAMKALIEDRFNTLTWLGQARHNPIQSSLMLKLIRAGFHRCWRALFWNACPMAWGQQSRCAG